MIGVSASPLLHASAVGAKDYAAWLAHIETRASGIRTEAQNLGIGFESPVRIQMGGSQGTMRGSSWVSTATASNGACFSGSGGRAVQHGMESEAAYNSQRSNSSIVICNLSYGSNLTLNSRARNGYTSLSGFEEFVMLMDELSFWDFSLGKPMTMNPRANTGPVDYVAAGW